jgi:hypothetical protein
MASGRNKVASEAGSTFSRAHQFRTRNDLIKTQRTRSNSNENAAKSTKLIHILPLITVWLQVRVLPGPPMKRWLIRFSRTVGVPHQKRLVFAARLLYFNGHQITAPHAI